MQLLFQVDQALMVLDQHIQTGCQVDQAVEIQLLFQVDQESTTYTDQVVLDQHIQVLDQHIQLLFQVDQALRSSRR